MSNTDTYLHFRCGMLALCLLGLPVTAMGQIVGGPAFPRSKCVCEHVDHSAKTSAKYNKNTAHPSEFVFHRGRLGDVFLFPFIGLDGDGAINQFDWIAPVSVDFFVVKQDGGLCDVIPESADVEGEDNNPGENGTLLGTSGRYGPTALEPVKQVSFCSTSSVSPCAGNQLPRLSSLGDIQNPGSGSAFRDVTFTDDDGVLIEVQFLTLQNIDVTSLDGNWVEGPAGTWTPTVSTSTATFRFSQQAGNTDKAIFEALVSDGCGQINIDPAMSWSGAANAAVAAGSETPGAFRLGDNYPNPFNPTTTVRFEVAEQAQVRVAVYDVLGRLVKTLATGEMLPGTYTATWDGTSEAGTAVSSGVYLYRMEAGSYVATKVMSLLK